MSPPASISGSCALSSWTSLLIAHSTTSIRWRACFASPRARRSECWTTSAQVAVLRAQSLALSHRLREPWPSVPVVRRGPTRPEARPRPRIRDRPRACARPRAGLGSTRACPRSTWRRTAPPRAVTAPPPLAGQPAAAPPPTARRSSWLGARGRFRPRAPTAQGGQIVTVQGVSSSLATL